MSQIAVVVKLKIKDGQLEAFTKIALEGVENAKAEPGTTIYAIHNDSVEANVVWLYELYVDKQSADAHSGSDAFRKWSKSLAPFVDGTPEFSFLTPIGGKGI